MNWKEFFKAWLTIVLFCAGFVVGMTLFVLAVQNGYAVHVMAAIFLIFSLIAAYLATAIK